MNQDDDGRREEGGDVEALARELCLYDDSLHHHDATDDFPCWHCKAKARDVLATDWLAARDAGAEVAAVLALADEIPAQVAIASETRRRIADWLREKAGEIESAATPRDTEGGEQV